MRLVSGLAPAVALAALGVASGVALAAGLVAGKDAGALAVSRVDALVVHAGAEELLALQLRYAVKGDKGLDALALVVPVPGVASLDAVVTPPDTLLAEVSALAGKANAAAAPVGAFETKALEGKGPSAVKALQGWLEAGGFPGFRDRELRFYAGAGFGFLATKVTGAKEKLPASGTLRPFGAHFGTSRVYLPLKLLALAGPLEVHATVLTAKPVDPARAEKLGFKATSSATTLDALPKSLQDLLGAKAAGLRDELAKGKVQVLALDAKLNADDKSSRIENWYMDPELPFKK